MIEVLVSIVIMGIGLLGLTSLQTVAMKNNHSAMLRTQASVLAYEFIDLMRANNADASFTNFSSATLYTFTANCLNATGCSATNMAKSDIYLWKQNLFNQLGSTATASINNASAPIYTLSISWFDDTKTAQTKTFATSFRL